MGLHLPPDGSGQQHSSLQSVIGQAPLYHIMPANSCSVAPPDLFAALTAWSLQVPPPSHVEMLASRVETFVSSCFEQKALMDC